MSFLVGLEWVWRCRTLGPSLLSPDPPWVSWRQPLLRRGGQKLPTDRNPLDPTEEDEDDVQQWCSETFRCGVEEECGTVRRERSCFSNQTPSNHIKYKYHIKNYVSLLFYPPVINIKSWCDVMWLQSVLWLLKLGKLALLHFHSYTSSSIFWPLITLCGLPWSFP